VQLPAQYIGYGAEDTDFGQVAASRGHRLDLGRRCVGLPSVPSQSRSARAASDGHRAQRGHLHRRWGWWPMTGWLREPAPRPGGSS